MRKYFSLLIAVLCFCTTAYSFLLRELFVASGARAAAFDGVFRVVIDAGHGGLDGGVVGVTTGVKESDLNLSIALLLRDEFVEGGFSVVLTRSDGGGLPKSTGDWSKREDMKKRGEIIRSSKADLVISVHQNYLPSSPTVRGAQVFFSAKSEGGDALAESIQKNLNETYSRHGVKGRVAKAGEYYLLERTEAPSVIVECGFLSSPDDEKLLCTDAHKKRVAQSIFSGVSRFLRESK